jgi:alcohol dehydrogenase
VIAVDVSSAALELARSVGAAVAVNAAESDVVAAVHEVTGGGAQVSVDALGSTTTCLDSIHSLRKRGRHVQVGLLVAGEGTPPIPMAAVIAGELAILGSHGMAAHDYPAMLDEIVDGALSPERLIRRRIDLTEASAALMDVDRRAGDGITIIHPREEA